MSDRDKLNQLGEKWYNMSEQGNEAARLALREEIFVLAYKLFPRQSDAMGLLFWKDWDKYDPNKGDLYGFMSYRLKMRMRDLWRQETSDDDSFDAPASPSEDTSHTKGDEIPTSRSDPENDVMFDATILELMTLMLDLNGRLGGKASNPVRINYFRLFFTDQIADFIQQSNSVEAFARRERDLFKVMKETFLNYFMRSPCSSVEDIWDTDRKLYGQMVDGRPMEPPKQPLPNDVYTTYLERVEHYIAKASAVSQQRTAYKTFMKEQLL